MTWRRVVVEAFRNDTDPFSFFLPPDLLLPLACIFKYSWQILRGCVTKNKNFFRQHKCNGKLVAYVRPHTHTKKDDPMYLEERLEFYRLVHVRIGLAQKPTDLFFGQDFVDAPQLFHHRGQILYGHMFCVWSLCGCKLLHPRTKQHVNIGNIDVGEIVKTGQERLAPTFVWRVLSCTWVNWLCSPGSETRTPTKVDMAFQLTVTRLGNRCLSPVTELFPQQQAGRAAITLPWIFFFWRWTHQSCQESERRRADLDGIRSTMARTGEWISTNLPGGVK